MFQQITILISPAYEEDQKIPLATYIIHNDEEQSLIEQVLEIKNKLEN